MNTPRHFTATANLGLSKIKRHLDDFNQLQEFMNEMVEKFAISVQVESFTCEGYERTLTYNWTGAEWEK